MNFGRDFFFQFLEQFDRHVVICHVDFAAAVAVNVCNFRRNWQVSDLIDNSFGVIPVSRATLQHDTFVDGPCFQFVCAVADVVFWLSPFVAKFLNNAFVHRLHRGVGQHFNKIRDRFGQSHLQGMVINRLHTQGIRAFLTADDVIDVFDVAVLQVAFIRRGCFWISQALPAEHEILSSHRVAVGPFCFRTQVESPDFEIFVFPAGGDARNDAAVLAVGINQAFQ